MGRLIDADALREYWLENGLNEYVYDTNAFLESIDEQPTVDAVPVVHGEWIGDTCSVCDKDWNYNMVADADDWGYFDPMPDFCPNCGARMDGKEGKWAIKKQAKH